MKNRVQLLFIVNNEVVVVENNDLTFSQVNDMKNIVAYELECCVHDVEVKRIELSHELSDYDVTDNGLVDWKDPYFKTLTGISCNVDIHTLLDGIIDGNFTDYLELS